MKGSIFVLQISVKQSGRFYRILRKRSFFVWQISAEQSCGAGSGSHLDISPLFRLRISFDVLLLACKRKLPLLSPVSVLWLCLLFLFYNFTDARPPCQTGGRSVYGTYYTYSTYQVFLRLWVIIKKARIIKGFRRFRACFFVVFWYTIIARSVHNYRTCGIQNSHGKYTKIARPVMAVCLRL